MPGKWAWTAQPKGENSFVVPFPNKTELARAIAFGSADIKSMGLKLMFEEYNDTNDDRTLPEVWVKVYDIPEDLKKVKSILCGIGSMIGATQKVDMKTTLHNEYGRILVAVIDPEKIPDVVNVVIGKIWFDARIVVEKDDMDSEPADMDEDNNQDGDEMEENEGADHSHKDAPKNDKISKADAGKGENKTVQGNTVAPNIKTATSGWSVEGLNAAQREEFYKEKAQEIIDAVVNREMEFLATKVAMENEEEVIVEDAVTDSDEEVQDTTNSQNFELLGSTWNCSDVGNTSTQKENSTPIRRSLRRQHTADQDSLERAEKMKAWRNLEDDKSGYFQEHLLDSVLEFATEEGGAEDSKGNLSKDRDNYHGDFHQKWLAV